MSLFTSLRLAPARDTDRSGKPAASEITLLAINATGTRVANARADRSIRIWKVQALALVAPVVIDAAHRNPVVLLTWSNSSELVVASVLGDDCVKLWQASGSLLREIKLPEQSCTMVEFSLDGAILAVAASSSMIFLDVQADFAETARFETPLGDAVLALKWANKGHEVLLVGLGSGAILLVRLDLGTALVSTSLLGSSAVACLHIDQRGKYFAAGGADGAVTLWRTRDLVSFAALTAVDWPVTAMSGSRDGSYLAVAWGGGPVRVFDCGTMAEVYEVPNSSAGSLEKLLVAWFPLKAQFVYTEDKGRTMGFLRKEEREEKLRARREDRN